MACTTRYVAYAQAIQGALADRPPELRLAPGDGLLAGAATLFARLGAHDQQHASPLVADRRLAVVGDGWLLPKASERVWQAPTVLANRASESHSALYWLTLPDAGRTAAGGAACHVLRCPLPPTTTAGDLLAFLDWRPVRTIPAITGDSSRTTPTALLVDGNRLGLLEEGAPS